MVGARGKGSQAGETVIRFENVGLRYGMGPEILRDISFEIPQRSFQFLTGPSGAGKTTLLRLLFMSLKPTRGLITVFGRDRARIGRRELPGYRRRIGVVFQDFRLLDHMTTYENVALPLRVRGREEASYRNDVVDLLNWVGLGDRMHVLPPVLSGGEKQRAAGHVLLRNDRARAARRSRLRALDDGSGGFRHGCGLFRACGDRLTHRHRACRSRGSSGARRPVPSAPDRAWR